MSQANVEIVRQAIDAFNRRDLDEAGRDWDPEATVDWSRSEGVEAGIYRGREATRAFWATWLELFDVFALEADEFIECGDQVVVPNRTYMQGRDGIKVEAQSTSVVTLHEGRIVEWRLYLHRDEALKAVGLAQ
jgi:ketosteroid isomerase-like protein